MSSSTGSMMWAADESGESSDISDGHNQQDSCWLAADESGESSDNSDGRNQQDFCWSMFVRNIYTMLFFIANIFHSVLQRTMKISCRGNVAVTAVATMIALQRMLPSIIHTCFISFFFLSTYLIKRKIILFSSFV
jgi:hypothetical protein